MPRPPRIWFPGAIYHVMVRGNNREPIFFTDADYWCFLRLLARARQEYECTLWAYVLMTNHFHLMVRTGQHHPVSKLMQSVNTAYTLHMHKRHGRVGHVFQGRFRSLLVETDSYALELTRYIHLNPVRAGMVHLPEDYRWSSYPAYQGLDSTKMVNPGDVLAMISPIAAEQRTLYTQFVRDGLAQDLQAFERNLLATKGPGSQHGVRHSASKSTLGV